MAVIRHIARPCTWMMMARLKLAEPYPMLGAIFNADLTADPANMPQVLLNLHHCESNLRNMSVTSPLWLREIASKREAGHPLTLGDLADVRQDITTKDAFKDLTKKLEADLLAANPTVPSIAAPARGAWLLYTTLLGNQAKYSERSLAALPVTPVCRFNNDMMRDSLRMRCGFPPSWLHQLKPKCICSTSPDDLRSPDMEPYHLLLCSKSDGFHSVHRGVQDYLMTFLRTKLGLEVSREDIVGHGNMRTDLEVRDLACREGAVPHLLDIASKSNYGKALTVRTAVVKGPGKVARVTERAKHAKYDPVVTDQQVFVPFVLEQLGGFGQEAVEFLTVTLADDMARIYANPSKATSVLQYAIDDIACIQRRRMLGAVRRRLQASYKFYVGRDDVDDD
jgi:hypothetical protein